MTPRLVVLRALGLGDFLTGVPAYRALARAFPQYWRALVAPAWLAPLVPLTGAFDELLAADELAPLPAAARHATIAVNLHGRGPQSHQLLRESDPERIVAYANTALGWTSHFPEWNEDEHEVLRWCRLLRGCGIPADPGALDLAPPPVAVPVRLDDTVVVHPGAKAPARRWPAERWAIVARDRSRRGETVVITGTPEERELALEVATRAGLAPSQVLAGRTPLAELAAIVAGARLVLANDTGVAHLAYAYRRPSVTVFGPMPPSRWGPPPRPQHQVVWSGKAGDPLGERVDRGLLNVGVQDVLAAADAALSAPRAA